MDKIVKCPHCGGILFKISTVTYENEDLIEKNFMCSECHKFVTQHYQMMYMGYETNGSIFAAPLEEKTIDAAEALAQIRVNQKID